MKKYSFSITFTPTAYATIDTTIIRHVYIPGFAVCVPFGPAGSCDLFAINYYNYKVIQIPFPEKR